VSDGSLTVCFRSANLLQIAQHLMSWAHDAPAQQHGQHPFELAVEVDFMAAQPLGLYCQ